MTEAASSSDAGQVKGHQRMLALLLAAAMFVLVVDTSLMNVSISAVVRDLGTTVSGVQSAIVLEALVSAAFRLLQPDRQARHHIRQGDEPAGVGEDVR